MKSEPIWAKALHISKDQLQQWESVKPPEIPLSYWCLKEALIPVQSFMTWAQEKHQLPCLNHSFLKEESHLRSTWKQFKDVGIWNEWLVPVGYWENILFIGCVEPPPELQLSFPVQYVLLSYQDIESLWQFYQKPQDSSSVEISSPAPRDDSSDPFSALEQELTATLSADKPKTSKEENSEITVLPELPEENFLTQDSPDLESFDQTSSEVVMPEGLDISLSAITTTKSQTATQEASSEPALEVDGPAGFDFEKDPFSEKENTPPPIPSESHLELEVYPDTGPIDLEKLELTQQQEEENTSSPPPLGSNENATNDNSINIQNDVIGGIFTELQNHFTHSLFLRLQQNKLVPEIWSLNWKPKNKEHVPLKEPSLFRIVTQSKHPFHGKPHPSPVNDQFFQNWEGGFGDKGYPEHITAVPVIYNEELLGVLCLAGPKECNNLNHLSLAEAAAKNLSQHLLQPVKATA